MMSKTSHQLLKGYLMDQKTKYLSYLTNLPVSHHITINMNIKSYDQMTKAVRLIKSMLTRRLCGRRAKMNFISFIETGSFTGNLHCHVVINAPHNNCQTDEYTTNILNHIKSFKINAIARADDAIKVDIINQTPEDKRKLFSYLLKAGPEAFFVDGSHVVSVK